MVKDSFKVIRFHCLINHSHEMILFKSLYHNSVSFSHHVSDFIAEIIPNTKNPTLCNAKYSYYYKKYVKKDF